MSDYKKCHECGEYGWKNHKCSPFFLFKHADWGDEWQKIRACSHEDAAEKFAKQFNEDGDYTLMNSEEDVLISDGAVEKLFTVSAEPDIKYYTNERVKP